MILNAIVTAGSPAAGRAFATMPIHPIEVDRDQLFAALDAGTRADKPTA